MKRILFIIILIFIIIGLACYAFRFTGEAKAEISYSEKNEETNIYYSDIIVSEFGEIGELYTYFETLNFDTSKETKNSSSIKMVNSWFKQKATLYVTGEMKLGIDLSKVKLFEDDEKVVVFVDKKEILKVFLIDYEKTYIENESGFIAKDYPAEVLTELYKKSERYVLEKELTMEQTQKLETSIRNELENMLTQIITEKETKIIFK